MLVFVWLGEEGSNPRHRVPKTRVLPTELSPNTFIEQSSIHALCQDICILPFQAQTVLTHQK